ncbi:hypothetical protein XELAEV_18045295mg [Xenopus laevis]|uniref:Uncharacterized protein n=1 Tax=Xenopus laevis TaxID=8355 RepID=A0A974C0B3_XENLA|nr:hypothetical protein XELAEV_18045295mg [Xenopus laevis]
MNSAGAHVTEKRARGIRNTKNKYGIPVYMTFQLSLFPSSVAELLELIILLSQYSFHFCFFLLGVPICHSHFVCSVGLAHRDTRKTPALPLSLGAALPLSLGAALPLSLGAALPLSLGAALPLSLGAALPLSLGAALPLSLGAALPLSLGASLPLSLGASQPLSLGASQPLSLGASQPHSLGASQPHSLGASLPLSLGASLPLSLGSSLPLALATSLPLSLFVSAPLTVRLCPSHWVRESAAIFLSSCTADASNETTGSSEEVQQFPLTCINANLQNT